MLLGNFKVIFPSPPQQLTTVFCVLTLLFQHFSCTNMHLQLHKFIQNSTFSGELQRPGPTSKFTNIVSRASDLRLRIRVVQQVCFRSSSAFFMATLRFIHIFSHFNSSQLPSNPSSMSSSSTVVFSFLLFGLCFPYSPSESLTIHPYAPK